MRSSAWAPGATSRPASNGAAKHLVQFTHGSSGWGRKAGGRRTDSLEFAAPNRAVRHQAATKLLAKALMLAMEASLCVARQRAGSPVFWRQVTAWSRR